MAAHIRFMDKSLYTWSIGSSPFSQTDFVDTLEKVVSIIIDGQELGQLVNYGLYSRDKKSIELWGNEARLYCLLIQTLNG